MALTDPAAAGVSFTGGKGDVAIADPLHGHPRRAAEGDGAEPGPDRQQLCACRHHQRCVVAGIHDRSLPVLGFRLQGIGVNIEGSDSNFPDGPTSVSVAVHADSSGQPGTKLVDLVSPTEYAAGHSFFEAPPGTVPGGEHFLRAGLAPPRRHRAQVAADLER